MAVTRRLFIGSAVATAASYLAGLDRVEAARKRRHTFAHAGLAEGVGTVGITVARTHYLEDPGQEAVALTPLDGEFLSGGVQSNFASNGYYTRNSYTRATGWTGPKPGGGSFAGFDDLNFLPIGIWAADFSQTSTNYDRVDDVGVNGFFPASGAITLSMAVSRGKWCTVPHDAWAGGTIPSGEDPAVMGVITGEEPSTVAEYDAITSAATTWLGSSDGPGRFHQTNFADNLMNGEVASTYFPDDMVLQGDYTNCDQYWYAGSAAGESTFKLHTRLYFNTAGESTQTQCGRGCHYGSMMDSIRKAYPGVGQVNPFGVWIEAAAPYVAAGSLAMTPAMLRWAVWATLVHGARGIHYFVHNFRTGDTWGSPPWDDHFGGPGIGGTGIYAAMKEVNERAVALAPVINSPMDGYFVYGDTESSGSIATSGFLTAVISTNNRSKLAGVDACCKWYPTTGKHYIFSTTREPEASTNIPVTFRMVDQGQTTAVEVHESNSITIQRGGGIPAGFCEFSDTFATAATYKTYRID